MLQILPQYSDTFHVFMRTEIVPGKKCRVTGHATFLANTMPTRECLEIWNVWLALNTARLKYKQDL